MERDYTVKFGETLKELIENGDLSRKALCRNLKISVSSLSQYISGRVTPSLKTLIALAEIYGVSLDYLIFGTDGEAQSPLDNNSFVSYLDSSLANFQAQNVRQTDLFVRVSHALMKQIEVVVKELIHESTPIVGMWSDDIIYILEKYSLETGILTMDLRYNIIVTESGKTEEQAKAGRFFSTVSQNLRQGRSYRYLLPAGLADWKTIVQQFKTMLAQDLNGNQFLSNCKFRYAPSSTIGGCGLYKIDRVNLQKEQPVIYEVVQHSLSEDGWIGYSNPTTQHIHGDVWMDISYLRHAIAAFENMWNNGEVIR